jgi:uncharacterized oligopeptide transporter (OPT) family protein
MAWQMSFVFGMIWVFITALRIVAASPAFSRNGNPPPWRSWIPGGIAVAVGIFNVPSFTLARAIGGIIAWWWSRKHSEAANQSVAGGTANGSGPSTVSETRCNVRPASDQASEKADDASSTVVVLASGLILGEGIMSIVNLLLASGHVPHL